MKHTEDLARNLESEFIYTKTGTCISVRWRALGWVPASEQPEIQKKWDMYKALSLRTLTEEKA